MPDPTPADAALGRRLEPAAARPLAVAFSGGSDSLATLVAAKTWGDRTGRPVVALTVDHGLNPASARWTAEAQAVAERLGAAWRGLSWTGAKPATGLPAAARAARHRLLAEGARAAGARVILLGHTADDRAESELIRQETPGLGHLREWSPSPAWPEGRDLFLLRPLLQAWRADLRTWLEGEGLEWLEDPANTDLRYARSRARLALAAAKGPADVGEASPIDSDLSAQAHWSATADSRLVFMRDSLVEAPAFRRLIGAALLCASGGGKPVRGEALDRLTARLRGGESLTATLCGARVVADADTIVFAREPGEARRGRAAVAKDPPEMAQPPGKAKAFRSPAVVDGRFEVTFSPPELRMGLLQGRLARLSPADAQAARSLPAYARGALPAVVDAAGAVSLPAPFGAGAAQARSLVGRRFAQAMGAVRCEGEI